LSISRFWAATGIMAATAQVMITNILILFIGLIFLGTEHQSYNLPAKTVAIFIIYSSKS
jgi:hypothetical protein